MLKIFRRIIIAAILIHASILAFFLLFIQYFQQDEWHAFGLIISYGAKYITIDKSLLELLLGDRIGARIITFNLFNSFGINPFPFGALALILHLANMILLFLLTLKLTKQSFIAILASLFFLINETSNEAYSWFGTMAGSSTSLFFFLISILFLLQFLDEKKYKYNLLSALFLWVSFLFKEIAAFAFILYPIIFLTYRKNEYRLGKLLKTFIPFIVIGVVMLSYFAKTVIFIPGDRASYINTGGSLISSLLIHSLQYPLEGIIQTIIPNSLLFSISPFLTKINNPQLSHDSLDFLIASQNKNAEITIWLLLITAVILSLIFIVKKWHHIDIFSKRSLIVSLAIGLLSFLPYVVINRSFSYLDSRYYYAASFGMSVFLATFLFNLAKEKTLLKLIAILIGVGYFLLHESILFSDFKLLADRSYERKTFLQQVENIVPKLPQNTTFYITGDSEGYYGIPELKVPFQSGFGQVLMVKYAAKKQLNPAFFYETSLTKALDVGFLYDILGQGYRKVKNQGFGYYYNKAEINKAISKKLFTNNEVISLYYKHETKKLEKASFN